MTWQATSGAAADMWQCKLTADDRPRLGAANRGITHAQESLTVLGTDAALPAVVPAA